MRVEQVTDPIAYHGEGPVWFPDTGQLQWVDMHAGDVLTLDDQGQISRRHVDSIAAALRPRAGGGTVLGVERGFALEHPDGTLEHLGELWADAGVRMNEGACDPAGRFYCGSMAYDRTPGAAALYRLNTDLTVDTVLENITISNGLDWSPDGSLVYYTDTATQQISVFDDDPALGVVNRRTFVEIPDGGRPDGLTVDAEGGVWTALVNSGKVHRYLPNGSLDAVIELPVTRVTACTFGGRRLDQLYITTSKDKADTQAQPLSGSLFCADVQVQGLPVRVFKG